jgi:nitroreductase
MEVFDAIASRHSYRGPFTDADVKRADLVRIVEAGLAAPSGMNRQTTTFVIVDDKALVRNIGAMHEKNRAMQSARAFIACVVNRETGDGLSFQVEDCAAAVENMLLAVTALGYATVWIDGWLRGESRAKAVGDILGVPSDNVVRILLPIGAPAEPVSGPEKKPFAQRAWFNRYGA